MIAAGLAAGAGELIQAAIVLIIILGSALARWLANAQKAGPPKRPAWQPPPVEDREVQAQIEEFLEQSAQRRGVEQPPAVPTLVPAEEPLAVELVPEQAVGGRIGRSVKEDLDNSAFRRRSTELGQEVAQSDEQFQQRVGQAFSGDVSQLAKRPGEAALASPTPVEELAEAEERTGEDEAAVPLVGLWTSPGSIVNAIILSEVLRTPEWAKSQSEE